MILGDLRINGVIRLWLDNINASRHTELSYIQAMQQYTEFTNVTPDELLHEAEQEILSGMLTRQRKLKGYLRYKQNPDVLSKQKWVFTTLFN